VSVSFAAQVQVSGVPLPTGRPETVDASPAAQELKRRLSLAVQDYVMGLSFGDPVRAAEVIYALMSVPGVDDVRGLELLRWPGSPDETGPSAGLQRVPAGQNVTLAATSIAAYAERLDLLRIVTR
jgi:hypothetical protein